MYDKVSLSASVPDHENVTVSPLRTCPAVGAVTETVGALADRVTSVNTVVEELDPPAPPTPLEVVTVLEIRYLAQSGGLLTGTTQTSPDEPLWVVTSYVPNDTDLNTFPDAPKNSNV